MKIFSDSFVDYVNSFIASRLDEGENVTRKDIAESLGLPPKETEGLSLVISQMFTLGLLNEFQCKKRIGIVRK